MAYKTVLDIQSENFDYFFLREMENITQRGKESLPKDLMFKILTFTGGIRHKALVKLNFVTKLFILWKSLGKRFWIVIEDEQNGLGLEDFKEYQKAIKKKDFSMVRAEDQIFGGHFFLANKELGDVFAYKNNVSVSPAYNYLIKGKQTINNKTEEWSDKMEYITRFLAFYESNRKNLSSNDINIPEWYVLLSLFHGKEMVGAVLYKETFKKAFQSSPGKIKTAFGSLQKKGLIEKFGESRGATLRITSLGRLTVTGILGKYALNC